MKPREKVGPKKDTGSNGFTKTWPSAHNGELGKDHPAAGKTTFGNKKREEGGWGAGKGGHRGKKGKLATGLQAAD